jgi:hypothetical protein
MHPIRVPWRVTFIAAATTLLSVACGGGSSDGSPAATGMSGQPQTFPHPVSQAVPRDCAAVTLDTGPSAPSAVTAVLGGLLSDDVETRWLIFVAHGGGYATAFYGSDVSSVAALAGHINAGWPWWSEGEPHWYNGIDRPGGDAACLEVTHDAGAPALAGTLRMRSGRSATLEGGSIPGSSYAFDEPARASAAAGRWALVDGSAIEVSDTGTFTGTFEGCAYQAQLSPASDRKNWFRLTMQLLPHCELLGHLSSSGLEGFAITYSVGNADRMLLHAMDAGGADYGVFTALGVRPVP